MLNADRVPVQGFCEGAGETFQKPIQYRWTESGKGLPCISGASLLDWAVDLERACWMDAAAYQALALALDLAVNSAVGLAMDWEVHLELDLAMDVALELAEDWAVDLTVKLVVDGAWSQWFGS